MIAGLIVGVFAGGVIGYFVAVLMTSRAREELWSEARHYEHLYREALSLATTRGENKT